MRRYIHGEMELVPAGSYAIRGYTKPDTLQYDISLMIEPVDGGYELTRWITSGNQDSGEFLIPLWERIKRDIGDVRLFVSWEDRMFRVYERYFSKHKFRVIKIKEYQKKHNCIEGNFVYCEILRNEGEMNE